jgi:hypothetical protein
VPPEWWKYKEPKRVSELAGYLISGTDQIGEAILGDLVRIHPMASERGRNALRNSAAHAQPGLHKVYDLHSYRDEKQRALDLWAARLSEIVERGATDNVVRLKAG